MTPVDWTVLVVYFVVLIGIGLWPSRRAAADTDDYFVSGRRLPWWMAGTSLIAASFASDTPLLVSGLVRSKGVWANWLWWGFGISTVLTVFLFAPLWRRSGVVTDAELSELRYGGRGAAVLRGAKAVYWGLLFNCFATGAWSVAGLVKVTGAATGMGRTSSVLLCAALGTAYGVVSGLTGLVLTDMFQFVVALLGGLAVAGYAIAAAGGWGAVLAAATPARLEMLPLQGDALTYALPFLLIQWWAWKNTDGSGVMVQRWAACKDERHATAATIWYAIVHYGLRCWPWVAAGLASIVLVPDALLPLRADGSPDHEAAYPMLIVRVLPAGIRGFVVAWFFAEFMSAITQAMSWGSSLLVNDLYRRFWRPGRDPAHYVKAGRIASVLVMGGAVWTAFLQDNIANAFTYVISGTAAVGVISALRWLWWRINAWSEITAMVLSPLMTFVFADPVLAWLATFGLPATPVTRTLCIVIGGAVPSILAAFMTAPDPPERLREFYRRVRPPSFGWGPVAAECPEVRSDFPVGRLLFCWAMGCGLVYGVMGGIGNALFGRTDLGAAGLLVAAGCGVGLILQRKRAKREALSTPFP